MKQIWEGKYGNYMGTATTFIIAESLVEASNILSRYIEDHNLCSGPNGPKYKIKEIRYLGEVLEW